MIDKTKHPTEPHELEAAKFILALEQQKAIAHKRENPTPQKQDKTRQLIDDIRNALDTPCEMNEIKLLEQQAKILDITFRRLMTDADTTFEHTNRADCDPMKYAAAFKAQDQYRRTVKTLKQLKRKKKTNKTRGKRS